MNCTALPPFSSMSMIFDCSRLETSRRKEETMNLTQAHLLLSLAQHLSPPLSPDIIIISSRFERYIYVCRASWGLLHLTVLTVKDLSSYPFSTPRAFIGLKTSLKLVTGSSGFPMDLILWLKHIKGKGAWGLASIILLVMVVLWTLINETKQV